MANEPIRLKCEAGHVTTVERLEEGAVCSQQVPSTLVRGASTICRLPATALLPSVETTPDGNVLAHWVIGMPDTCGVCQRDKFIQGERVVVIKTDPTPDDPVSRTHYAHDGCFYRIRSSMYEQQFANAYQSVAYLIASIGNTVRVRPHAIRRAQKSECAFVAAQMPDGSMVFALKPPPAHPSTDDDTVPQ